MDITFFDDTYFTIDIGNAFSQQSVQGIFSNYSYLPKSAIQNCLTTKNSSRRAFPYMS